MKQCSRLEENFLCKVHVHVHACMHMYTTKLEIFVCGLQVSQHTSYSYTSLIQLYISSLCAYNTLSVGGQKKRQQTLNCVINAPCLYCGEYFGVVLMYQISPSVTFPISYSNSIPQYREAILFHTGARDSVTPVVICMHVHV